MEAVQRQVAILHDMHNPDKPVPTSLWRVTQLRKRPRSVLSTNLKSGQIISTALADG